VTDRIDFDARTAWNKGAEAYSKFIESGADYYRLLVHGPELLAACGDVHGKRALDLGCGHGYFSRALANAGAQVVGVDLSDRLIDRARALESQTPLGIEYHVVDAARIGERLADASFDLVTACMSLQDMVDPAYVLLAASRVLTEGGRMVFSVPHPATDPPHREWLRDGHGRKLSLCLDRYFEAGPAVCDWNMKRLTATWQTPCWRFTLTQWSAFVRSAGFMIRALSEPHPSSETVGAHPELEDCSRMPYFLIFDLMKPGWLRTP
jgi:2-polyprenyl-3-methyl-5-hydroxy-6-metoxy-1,4-benzoquinol methylase